jgi:hypothetical protein
MTPDRPSPPASGLERLIDQARTDLALRSSVAPERITVIEAVGVVWPNSAMGCPQPGMAYLQVPSDGTRIILEADGRRYAYHYGGRRGLFLCEATQRG